MMEELSIAGVWWIPGHNDKKVAGVLKFSSTDGARLETIGGDFSAILGPSDIAGDLFAPLICGYARNGHDISLVNCREVGHTFGEDKYSSSEWLADYLIDGYCFEKVDDMLFDGTSMSVTSLKEWLGMSGITANRASGDGHGFGIGISAAPPEPIQFEIPLARIQLSIDVAWSMSIAAGWHMEDHPRIGIFPKAPLDLFALMTSLVIPIHHFLSFGFGTGVLTTGQTVQSKMAIPTGPQGTSMPSAALYSTQMEAATEKLQIYSSDMLFTFRDIEPFLPLAIEKWLDLEIRFSYALTRLLEAFYMRTSLRLHQAFLELTQFLEAYHRFKTGNSAMSFADRIEQIVTGFLQDQAAIVSRIAVSPDNREFKVAVRESRNYFTHLSVKKGELAITSPNHLYRLTQKLHLLAVLCLLQQIGMPGELSSQFVLRNHRYSHWLD